MKFVQSKYEYLTKINLDEIKDVTLVKMIRKHTGYSYSTCLEIVHMIRVTHLDKSSQINFY